MVIYRRVSSGIAELHRETNSENSEGAAQESGAGAPVLALAQQGLHCLSFFGFSHTTCICGGIETGLYSQQPCKSTGRWNICLLCEGSGIPECRLGTWIQISPRDPCMGMAISTALTLAPTHASRGAWAKASLPFLSHLRLPKSGSSRILKVIQDGTQEGSLGYFQYCRKPKGNHAFTWQGILGLEFELKLQMHLLWTGISPTRVRSMVINSGQKL